MALILVVLALLCVIAYGRALTLPLISDDYDQIARARRWAPAGNWPDLLRDPLYRCRATSLLLTYWTERLFGISPLVLNASSLLLHVFNTWLIFLFGRFRPIGWRLSALAAGFFAVAHCHQEAVTWYAAVHGLLVFFFSVLCVWFWLLWLLEKRGTWPWLLSFCSFILAIFSKEPGVAAVPLLALATMWAEPPRLKRLLATLPFAAVALAYFDWTFLTRSVHQHFNDGTFSLGWHFAGVLWQSFGRMFWVSGLLSLVICLVTRKARDFRLPLLGAFAWVIITFLPVSFLTYMPFVPSRHTYFASAGLALVVACGLLALFETRRRLAIGAAVAIVVLNCAYLWVWKQQQMLDRALPTEQLVALAERTNGPVYVHCFPYSPEHAILAVTIRTNRPRSAVIWDPEQTHVHQGSAFFCWERHLMVENYLPPRVRATAVRSGTSHGDD